MNFELWEGLWVMIVEGIERASRWHGEGIKKALERHREGMEKAWRYE
jgi:hypothetical protein